MSTLSELLPSGGNQNEVEFVASGTLPNGRAVSLKANGTVEVISQVAQAGGTGVVFETSTPTYDALCFDPSNVNTFIIAYRDGANSGYGTAVVGTVSGTSLSFGTPVVFVSGNVIYVKASFDSNTANQFVVSYRNQSSTGKLFAVVGTVSGTSISFGSIAYVSSTNYGNYPVCAFDPNTANKFVIAYAGFGNYGTAVVGTVSGTSISFGSEYIFNSVMNSNYTSVSFDPNTANKFVVSFRNGNTYGSAVIGTVSGTSISYGALATFNAGFTFWTSVAFDPNTANKFVVVYTDMGNGSSATACVGTVSGTTISFGAEYVIQGDAKYTKISFDPNTANKFVVVYRDSANSYGGSIKVGTVSGTAISFGSAVSVTASKVIDTSISFDPNTANKFAVAYVNSGNLSYGTAVVGTVSGTSASFGSAVVFNSATTIDTNIAYDPNTAGKFAVAYVDSNNSGYGTAVVGTVSGTSISYSSAYVFNAADSADTVAAFDPSTAGNIVFAYRDSGNSGYGTAILGQVNVNVIGTNLTSTNLLGISAEAITSGETGVINTWGGLNEGQTSLTPASIYYVQENGTISTVATAPAQKIGQAISATTLNLKDL